MRVLVTGASGFIGRAVAEALSRAGHQVIHAARAPAPRDGESLAVDFSRVPDAAWWQPRLAGVDAVVNAVGILREQGVQSFDALHARAPGELFIACAAAKVRAVVQVSALGADESAQSGYHRSKKAADDVLRSLPLQGVIVQPSLVYGAGGSSASLFDTLATMPFVMLPGGGRMLVQPVHIDDVVAGIVAALACVQQPAGTIAFAGPRPLTLREYLAALRRALGLKSRQLALPMPEGLFMFGARIAGRLPGSFLDRDTASMLLRGNAADAAPFAGLLGRAPHGVDRFVDPTQAPARLREALLGTWLPVLRYSVALLWIWTGIVSLGLYPVPDSLALLARVGLEGAFAKIALYGAAALDLAFGILTLVLPASRRGLLWLAQLLLVAGYTALITVFLPEYWLHPYGPISKNLPVMAAIALLWAADAAHRGQGG